MIKKIHYCWFGNGNKPKIFKKCLESWNKYLKDFEIIEWNENNFDVNSSDFSKKAYENKKYAFVSDYCRMKVLEEHGGLYLDTDMEITKDISKLLEDDVFLGVEDSGYIAAGSIWAKEANNPFISECVRFYETYYSFDVNKLFDISIPKIITNILNDYNKEDVNGIDVYNNMVYVYPKEYFYPINYDFSKKEFTENTCMIHYYNADWVPKKEKFHIFLNRTFGKTFTKIIMGMIKVVTYPFRLIHRIFKKIDSKLYRIKAGIKYLLKMNKRLKKLNNDLLKFKDSKYVIISHPDWFGVTNSTKSLFSNWVGIRDTYFKKEPLEIAKMLVNANIDTVMFSGMAKGYEKIIENIHNLNKDIKVKILWHGSNALLSEYVDYLCFMNVMNLYKMQAIDEIVFFKKSMYEFYNKKGFNVSFLANIVNIDNKDNYIIPRKDNNVKIGIYASLGRWLKNSYNQVSAASLFDNALADITPINYEMMMFAKSLDLDTSLSNFNNVSRNELFAKMASNDVNTYVSFTECSPLIPLESLELGVPCITGDNHHYFENTPLEEHLIVTKEDNILAIYDKMKKAIENKEEIITLYKEWKKDYLVYVDKLLQDFMEKLK